MIKITKENGTEFDVYCEHNPKEVHRLLKHYLTPEGYEQVTREALESEEVFIEFTGARRDRLPTVRYHMIHLDREQDRPALSRGDFIISIEVHKDHLDDAKEIARKLRTQFKNANDWNETTRLAPDGKFFNLPGEKI